MQLKTIKNLSPNYFREQIIRVKVVRYRNIKVLFSCDKSIKEKSGRRAVSEVITTLLLLSITVMGAIMVYVIFQQAITGNALGGITLQKAPTKIVLVGYDTRAGGTLNGIANLNNFLLTSNTNILCTILCVGQADQVPATSNGGTDFIVLKFRNQGASNVILNGLTINEVSHSWDQTTKGVILNPSSGLGGAFPLSGKFSVLSTDTTTPRQFNNSTIPAEADVLVVIKLSPSISPDIPLNSAIRITINIGDTKAQTTFIAPAGQAS